MYLVQIDDNSEIGVELTESDRGRWSARTHDGEEVELELRGQRDDGSFVVLVDGEERVFDVATNSGGFFLAEGDEHAHVDVTHAADLVMEKRGSKSPDLPDEASLNSPITGIVLEVLVDEGQHVVKGDPLIIVEAMKMENTLTAPRGGDIVDILTAAGETVFVDDELVRFE